jgi:hypothetical protein
MLFKSFGLFWSAMDVEWSPGKGVRGAFRLLGRRGKNRPTLKLCDFRYQQGIYILYGNYGPYYVGLTREQGLGKRLKDHRFDQHKGRWDRFSWFGFRAVLRGTDALGLSRLRQLAELSLGSSKKAIGDIEALLIRSMGLSNVANMKFASATEWKQVRQHEVEHYMGKMGSR